MFPKDQNSGINDVQSDMVSNLSSEKNQIYTIDGRRVAKAEKGLYIVNGKKTLYK